MLFGVYVLEAVNLPAEMGTQIRAALDADVEAWSRALQARRPRLSADERLVLVQAARSVVHDVVRVARLHARPGISHELFMLVQSVLLADVA